MGKQLTTTRHTELATRAQLTAADIARSGAEAVAGKAPGTRRKYSQRLFDFAQWAAAYGGEWDKRMISQYREDLAAAGKSPSTINGHLVAVRAMLREAGDLGLLDEHLSERLCKVEGVDQHGTRAGNWLGKSEAQELVELPDTRTLKGKRDKAILALLLTCGLRREELATVTLGHLQQREGHWCLVDILGKRGKVRTVKVPVPVKRLIDGWLRSSGRSEAGDDAPLFVAMAKGERLADHASLTAQAVYNLVVRYASAMGKPKIRPHDLRRTMAKLALKGGAPVEQISQALGHESLDTTKRYLGLELNLDDSAPDHVGLELA